jgi:hypothetical protein
VNLEGIMHSAYPAVGTYKKGTRVVVDAIPSLSYRFIRWSGDIESTSKSVTIQIDKTKSIQAVFTRIVPNWLIATIAITIAVPLILRWRRKRLKDLTEV